MRLEISRTNSSVRRTTDSTSIIHHASKIMESFTLRFRDNDNALTKTVIQASGRADAMNQFRSLYPTNLLYYCINNNDLDLHETPNQDQS